MTVAAAERACQRCGIPISGRADKRFCSDGCRLASRTDLRRSRAEPSRVLATVTAIRAAPGSPLTWEPSGDPREAYKTAEPCPHCGAPLMAGPRGTWRTCPTCPRSVTPAAVRAPYDRDSAAPQRQVKSQRERDLDALDLAQRKGVMLGQLGQLADDDRLAEESRPVVEWFRDEVKAAAGGYRLDELAELLPQAGIRRRHWWHGPPAIGAGYDDENGEVDYTDEGGYPLAIEAAPAINWADEMTARGYLIDHAAAPGGCQIFETRTGPGCGLAAVTALAGWRVCDLHRQALTPRPRSVPA